MVSYGDVKLFLDCWFDSWHGSWVFGPRRSSYIITQDALSGPLFILFGIYDFK